MKADELRDLQQRGRFFYEMFPGAKAADEWMRDRDRRDRVDSAKQLQKTRSDASSPDPTLVESGARPGAPGDEET
jgi:hypothetical protein